MNASGHPIGTAITRIGTTPVRRRGLLAGLATIPLLILAATSTLKWPLAPARAAKRDPEPLRIFPGLAEGFYRAGGHVYYLDEHSATWAPRNLDETLLTPFVPGDIPALLHNLRRRHWAWAVEHAALRRLDTDRPFAIALLSQALRHDPAANPRLCDLLALILARTAPYRLDSLLALADPAATRSTAIAARIAKWRTPSWLSGHGDTGNLIWRSPGTGGALFTARIARR
jgi:hypothetical protein